MSVTEPGKIEGILEELRNRPSSERVRPARMILEMVENIPASSSLRKGSPKDLVGILKSCALPPTDDECWAILDEDLIKTHVNEVNCTSEGDMGNEHCRSRRDD